MSIRIKQVPLNLALLRELELMVFGESRSSQSRLDRISSKQPLFLVAYDNKRPVGFKLGYAVAPEGPYFSWLGGVNVDYRRQGIAWQLLITQETWACEHGFREIYFTTFDRFPEMVALGRKAGYELVGSSEDGGEPKYRFSKQLG